MLAMWGRLVYRRRWVVLALSIPPLAASVLALQRGGTLVNAYPSGTEYDRAFKLMQRELPQAGGSSFTLVFGSTSLTVPDPRFRRMMQAALAPLRHDPRVSAVQPPYDTPVPRALVSRDGKHALALVALREEFNVARSYY